MKFLRHAKKVEPAGRAHELGGDGGADDCAEVGRDEGHPRLHVLEHPPLGLVDRDHHLAGGALIRTMHMTLAFITVVF